MKISTIEVDGEIALGVAVEGGFALATGWTGGERDLVHALATDTLSELAPLTSAKADVSFEEVRFLPPVPAPGKIICVGVNYDAHREEMGRVKVGYPTLFVRWPSSVVGHRQPILRPKVSERFDYEGELAVIIGRRGREAPAAEALSLVAGYACFNDGSVRDYQRHSSQFTPGKNFEASGGFGPWMGCRCPTTLEGHRTKRVG
ncbi:MAG: fumarylacetoacetate hydrolase family protein [Myxococcota bacterium]